LSPKELEGLSRLSVEYGIRGLSFEAIPPGGFDDTCEFKDFAWPTTGLSPVNAKQK
jgi:hypothetical protein